MERNQDVENFNDIPQPIHWGEVEPPKKESIFKKYGFLFGILTSLAVVFLAAGLVVGYLKISGEMIILGENGVSQVESDILLDKEAVKKLDELYSYLKVYYYEDFDKEEVLNGLYTGLVGAVDDPYTVYYTPEEYEELMVSTSGTYYGIGAGLTQNIDTMEVTVSKVYKGTPSEAAGMKNGDIIISVNDIEATSMELSELVTHIRGEEGTTVHIKLYRSSTDETLELDVERKFVELPSIEAEMLEGNIGYIQILEFQSKTDEQFETMIEELKAQGAKGLILDVRANPGGLLSSSVNMLDYLLPEGLLVYVEDKYGNREDYSSMPSCVDLPMVLLVDGSSASASEIMAGALKDYGYATLVGTTTYGKGIVQSVVPMEEGDAIKLTTAKYFTPKGNFIHGVGIEPDVVVEYEYSGPVDENYDKQYDSQFLKAVEVMQGMLAE